MAIISFECWKGHFYFKRSWSVNFLYFILSGMVLEVFFCGIEIFSRKNATFIRTSTWITIIHLHWNIASVFLCIFRQKPSTILRIQIACHSNGIDAKQRTTITIRSFYVHWTLSNRSKAKAYACLVFCFIFRIWALRAPSLSLFSMLSICTEIKSIWRTKKRMHYWNRIE